EFVTRQRISELKQTVVPVTDLDDPLIIDPPYLVSVDYEQGILHLFLQRPVNAKWTNALHNMRSTYTSVMNKGPERFSFAGNKTSIPAQESDVQRIIDHFKEWLPNANHRYEEMVRTEKQQAEAQQREQLQKEIEEQERRQRILANVKI